MKNAEMLNEQRIECREFEIIPDEKGETVLIAPSVKGACIRLDKKTAMVLAGFILPCFMYGEDLGAAIKEAHEICLELK